MHPGSLGYEGGLLGPNFRVDRPKITILFNDVLNKAWGHSEFLYELSLRGITYRVKIDNFPS